MSNDSPQLDDDRIREQVESRLGSEVPSVGTLREIVGIGGMAAVYRAETPSGDAVAVKLMHQHLATNEQLRRRFLREAELMGRVDHPNAVTVYDQDRLDTGEAYFVMELLDGWEVETVWKNKDGPFPVPEALEVAAQALICLEAYHDERILHRDLKPSNLFLTREGVVKIIDFGVARPGGDDATDTRSGTALGTPAYMAPEQAMGKIEQLDDRTDLYGMGAVLFTILSGRRVREAESSDQALVMAATEPADSLARHAPAVPTEVVRLVDRALAWDPAERFASTTQMREAIETLLQRPEEQLRRSEPRVAAQPPDAETALEEDAADLVVDVDAQSIEGMRAMFARLETALNAARIYEWDHDKSRERLRSAYEAFRSVIDREEGEVYWHVRPHSFEVGGDLLWDPEPPFEFLPYHLFIDGFRRLQLRSSMTREEFGTFAEWLALDPNRDLPVEDDLATALWDLALESVDAKVVSAPVVVDPDRPDVLVEEEMDDLAGEIEGLLDDGAGRRLLKTMRSGADAEAEAMQEEAYEAGAAGPRPGRDFTRAERGIVDPQRLEQLSEAIEPDRQGWERRIERIVSELWGECIDLDQDEAFAETTRALASLYLSGRQLELLFRVLLRSYESLDEKRVRDFFRHEVLDAELVDDVHSALRDVFEAPDDAAEPQAAPPSNLYGLYRRFLRLLPGDRFETMLQNFVAAPERLREPIREYLRLWIPGRERWLANRLDAFETEARVSLLEILAETESEAARDVLVDQLDHPESRIRAETLELLERHFELDQAPPQLDRRLGALITDDDPSNRLAALELARRRHDEGLVSRLAERARSKEFSALPPDEQRAVMETLAELDEAEAQEVAIEWAEQRSLMPSRNREETRVLAMRVLRDIGDSPEALEAVGAASSWWDSEQVERAAEAAARRIERRMDRDS